MADYIIGFIDEDDSQNLNFFNSFNGDEFEVKIIDPKIYSMPENIVDAVISEGIDLLIVDYWMPALDFNGTDIIKIFRTRNQYFPVLLASSRVLDALDAVDDPNITCDKDIWGSNQTHKVDFEKRMKRLINDYKERVAESYTQLNLLIERLGRRESLTAAEEEQYIELNNFIETTSGADSHIARQYYSTKAGERFDVLIEKTEELLNKLQ